MKTCKRCGAPLKNGECEYCGEKEANAAKISKNDAKRAQDAIFSVRLEMLQIERRLMLSMIMGIVALLVCLAGIASMLFYGASQYDTDSVSAGYEVEQEEAYEIRGGVE